MKELFKIYVSLQIHAKPEYDVTFITLRFNVCKKHTLCVWKSVAYSGEETTKKRKADD